jgi:hypothetical protein
MTTRLITGAPMVFLSGNAAAQQMPGWENRWGSPQRALEGCLTTPRSAAG